ncbi:SMI1/KNR4 family protein [Microbacterium sp. YY-03]|uniref:SMI1/KNR4 family protein n=1 Tax=Microbacterium sp. YY-03 TaxID=3421636 RepID=UPI003D17D7E7
MQISAADPRFRPLPDAVRELSADVRAFDAALAARVSTDYLDHGYWVDLEVDKRWLVIGDNGAGDHWLLGPDGEVWFFDHNYGERAALLFEPLEISVTEWLMMAHLLGRTENAAAFDPDRLAAAIDAISPGLAERWPYELPVD